MTLPQVAADLVQRTPLRLPGAVRARRRSAADLWHIRSNDAAAALRDPTDEQLLSRNGHGFYRCDFHEIDREFVGLAWNWR